VHQKHSLNDKSQQQREREKSQPVNNKRGGRFSSFAITFAIRCSPLSLAPTSPSSPLPRYTAAPALTLVFGVWCLVFGVWCLGAHQRLARRGVGYAIEGCYYASDWPTLPLPLRPAQWFTVTHTHTHTHHGDIKHRHIGSYQSLTSRNQPHVPVSDTKRTM
jgi:hypothetical protein